jgi:hypothetical protein
MRLLNGLSEPEKTTERKHSERKTSAWLTGEFMGQPWQKW